MTLPLRMLIGAGGGPYSPTNPPFDTSWSRSGSNPIMTPAVAWEETALQEPNVIYEGGVWKMWFTGGWTHPAMGYATSSDGLTWTKYASNPVYGQGGSGYANAVASGEVIKVASTYWLFTSGGSSTTDARSTFRVATSPDGIAWTTQSSSITIPSGKTLWGNRNVWIEGSTWYMLQEAGPTVWEIYLYTSSDGLTWSIANSGSPLSTLQRHAGGMYGGPTMSQLAGAVQTPTFDGTYHTWYHAAPVTGLTPTNIYHATSPDKITWTPNDVLTHTGSGDEADQIADPSLVVVAGIAYLFYDAVINSTQRGVLMLATAPATFGGGGGGGGGTDFLSRPSHAAYVIDGDPSVTITDVSIVGGTRDAPSGMGISISNVSGPISITDVDLAHLVGGIYLYNCTGTIEITGVRSENIGDGTIGSGHSNHIQLAECSLDGSIHGNEFRGGRTEDMLSIYHSGGVSSGHELVIETNRLQGLVTTDAGARAWTSGSGTGIIVGDGPGDSQNGHVIIRNNTLLTPGQVGIQLIDGPAIEVYGNTIYGEEHTSNNNPMTSYAGNPIASVHDNRYYWTNVGGGHPVPWWGAGTITAARNVQDASIDPVALEIVL